MARAEAAARTAMGRPARQLQQLSLLFLGLLLLGLLGTIIQVDAFVLPAQGSGPRPLSHTALSCPTAAPSLTRASRRRSISYSSGSASLQIGSAASEQPAARAPQRAPGMVRRLLSRLRGGSSSGDKSAPSRASVNWKAFWFVNVMVIEKGGPAR